MEGAATMFSGMSTRVVMRRAAVAAVAVSNPSQSVRPGSFTCTCVSTMPGITTRSPTSWTSRAGGWKLETGGWSSTRSMRVSRTYTVAGCTPEGSTTLVDRIPYTPPMIRSVLSVALAYLLIGAGAPQPAAPGPVTYEAYAVRFGILPAFSVAGLIAGAERGRT